jgi:hypothetical protein
MEARSFGQGLRPGGGKLQPLNVPPFPGCFRQKLTISGTDLKETRLRAPLHLPHKKMLKNPDSDSCAFHRWCEVSCPEMFRKIILAPVNLAEEFRSRLRINKGAVTL